MNPEQAKIKNIIDMAVGFSAIMRVFEEGSASKIKNKLESILPEIASLEEEQDFRKYHDSFCRWFAQNVKTAERYKKDGTIKWSTSASYGQGAKVLDIALKVFVYYCHLPDSGTAKQTIKWLNSAIDSKMLNYLKKMPDTDASSIQAAAIEQVDANTYATLQRLVHRDIDRSFSDLILPVQWDDIMWRQLNK